jgi:tetratricopeptide (TPR) repeat protein
MSHRNPAAGDAMFDRALLMAACLAVLAGCTTAPVAPPLAQISWRDDAFGYDAAQVEKTRQELFTLGPDLQQKLHERSVLGFSQRQQMNALLDLLYGPKRERFQYAAGHTTMAADTWQRKRGDCLSLAILTYAAARELRIPAQMQEVDVPILYDRRGELDFVNRHVNVRFHRGQRMLDQGWTEPHDVVVDFEPEFGSRKIGRSIDEAGILARFYNNIAAEYLSEGKKSLAYSFFKAAIVAEPEYAASYINLAVLYRAAGMDREAEQLLLHAVELSDRTEVILPLNALHALMVEQGRDAEALAYAQRLKSARDSDPYFWIGLGLRQLKDSEYKSAIDSLERASEMVNGFPEVHQYLALAYFRSGNRRRADEQLVLLESLGDELTVTGLRTKFKTLTR